MTALLQQGVAFHAERRPEATAAVHTIERMTYAQLEKSSNQLARVLKELGCKRGDRVCLLMPKSLSAMVGILGVLKADCTYVPIDPLSPAQRVAKIVDLCDCRALLGAGPVTGLLNEVLGREGLRRSLAVGWLGPENIQGAQFRPAFTRMDYLSCPDHPPNCANTLSDPAYILFTSGSTGTPKGVIVTHANVSHFLRWATRYFGVEPSDKISAHTPLHFDLSVFDIFGTFDRGAELHLVPHEFNLLPHKLADFIRTSELTQWFSVPSVLNYMAKFGVVKQNDFPTLKRILWCGEVFPTPSLMYWMTRLPQVTFTNLYGPTETTIASSYYTVPACPEDETAAIPIGRACDGEELLVLDERLQPVAAGTVGDLYIRGAGLSPGYWKESEKTKAVFLPNPHSTDPTDRLYKTGDLARIGTDGLIYFHGRSDFQIKSRGYRIELGEIETALHALRSLRECAILAIETDGFEGTSICCAYVPEPDTDVNAFVLRKELGGVLPPYMVPSLWMAFDNLPKNSSGKIDRNKLKEQFLQQRTAPRQVLL
jgi:amino acid adenylation domain-containing protein